MIDRLRMFWNRPLRDGDRRRLFAIVVGLLVAVAAPVVVLAATGSAPEPTRGKPRTTPPAAVPFSTARAPSEESHPGKQAVQRDIARSKQAARRFLAAYLPYTYGRGDARTLPVTTPALRAVLNREAPRVPAAERRRRPRVELLQSNGVNQQSAQLLALVSDGARRYSVVLELANTPAGWIVVDLGS